MATTVKQEKVAALYAALQLYLAHFCNITRRYYVLPASSQGSSYVAPLHSNNSLGIVGVVVTIIIVLLLEYFNPLAASFTCLYRVVVVSNIVIIISFVVILESLCPERCCLVAWAIKSPCQGIGKDVEVVVMFEQGVLSEGELAWKTLQCMWRTKRNLKCTFSSVWAYFPCLPQVP